MVESTSSNPKKTHTAYALKREGKKFGRWLEVGSGRIDRANDIAHVFLDRMPIGGFTGYVHLAPIGAEPPPPPQPKPQRPGEDGDDEGD
jgi:hypothetical protein